MGGPADGKARGRLALVGRGQLNHRQIAAGGSSNLHERARVRAAGERVARRARSEGRKDGGELQRSGGGYEPATNEPAEIKQ